MSQIANVKDVSAGCNAGKIGADNTYDVQGGVGKNASLGNVTDVKVCEANDGNIGAENQYDIKGGLGDCPSIGNVSGVSVGQNSGSIGAGNKINIS
uniref:Uncharacterized protein n=1 Tax=Sparus aurata TaxID=8175 RepID=A0A671VDF7_SPAAU